MSTDMSRPTSPSPIVIDGISYIPSNVLLTGIAKLSFKDDRAFAIVDPQGEAPRLYSSASELGFYFNDTRYLSTWEMTFNGEAPVSLSNELRFGGNTAVFSMTNPDLKQIRAPAERIPRDTFLIRRVMSLHEDSLFETVEIKNFAEVEHELQLEHWAGGMFDDIFEVRGYARKKRGRLLSVEEGVKDGEQITVLQYEGLDSHIRKTFIRRQFSTEKIRISPTLVGYFSRVKIPAKQTILLKTIISFDHLTGNQFYGTPYGDLSLSEKMQLLGRATENLPFSALSFWSDNAILNRAIISAQNDIYMLLTEEPGDILYAYAGIAWFSAPFGRDGLTVAYQLLPWYPNVSKGVLEYAFQTMGSKDEPFTDEQPGKIFHEMRRGEMANTREVPFIPYYGSIDSTPLALILLEEYIKWTMDMESLHRWWPFALRALEWMNRWGDYDQDKFLEYAKQSPKGLVNQGWKDSFDSVMHADGILATPPIRLCEVQGYAYRARMGMAALAKLMGDYDLAYQLRRTALELKIKFHEQFWDPEKQFIYLALDGNSQPCAVRSSNMGQCLWAQILTVEQADAVGRYLMSDPMFSGHGIRTLSSDEIAYNPLSYHNGSVWPHDNSIILEGFRNYGMLSAIEKLSLALFGVLESSKDFRLPELYCGFRKRGTEPPIPYQVACKPQAWAAGSLFLMLKSLLGLSMDVDQTYLVFNSPLLTERVTFLEIKNLRGRDWEIDLYARRSKEGTTIEVHKKKGNLRSMIVK